MLPTHLPPPSYTRAQSCNPMGCSPPGSSVHGLFQARIQEWVATSFSVFTQSFLIETTGDPTPLSTEEGFVFKYTYFKISETGLSSSLKTQYEKVCNTERLIKLFFLIHEKTRTSVLITGDCLSVLIAPAPRLQVSQKI